MRLGAEVHSSSPAAAEISQWLYLRSRETSVCRLRWVSSVESRGANQSCGMVPVVGGGLASSEVGESDSKESPGVMGCTLVSAMTNIRSEALWRAPPPLAVLCMAAWTSWQAALWRLMRRASWTGHSPAMWVQESDMWHSGHAFVGARLYRMASLPLYMCPYRNFSRVVPSQGLWVSFL